MIVLTQVGGTESQYLKGDDDMIESIVQVDVYAKTRIKAESLARAARDALMPPADEGSVKFWRASASALRDLGEQETEGFVHRLSRDFTLRHTAGD